MKKIFLLFFFTLSLSAQRWQQQVDYKMNVYLDTETADYKGTQKLVYTNNSPETLHKVFYHLYFNAFSPNSEMAIRLKNAPDKNGRFKVDLDSLNSFQQGLLKVISLKQYGKDVAFIDSETILEVVLNEPLKSGESTELEMSFVGHVPDLIRRSGKNSKEGVAYSMGQWYPKLCEYDNEGWNTDPYTGREFHGVWGDFDVSLTLNKNFIVAASGILQADTPLDETIIEPLKKKAKKKLKTWRYIANKVHDFTWAADPDYIHDVYPGPNGVTLNFYYKNNEEIVENWKKLQPVTAELMTFFNEKIGDYPYKEYSVVQGGDGGMEYAMMTLITGERKYGSLVGVTAHELAHSWFQNILATNETKYEWMDEGFTTFISTLATNKVLEKEVKYPFERFIKGYTSLAKSGVEQNLSTNANRYNYNFNYETSAYVKGALFLVQLGYIIGYDNLYTTLQSYYDEYKFTHPLPNDVRRIAERISGIQLRWFVTDWTQTTNKIDYAIESMEEIDGKTYVHLKRNLTMPMPVQLSVTYKDGNSEVIYIPLSLMRGEKNITDMENWRLEKDWTWADPNYTVVIDKKSGEIEKLSLDINKETADIERFNNYYPRRIENQN